jgi:hypothetical protein
MILDVLYGRQQPDQVARRLEGHMEEIKAAQAEAQNNVN